MLIKKTTEIASSEITLREQYWNRREFIKHAGLAGTGTLAVHGTSGLSAVTGKLQVVKSSLSTQGEKLTSLKDITSYNNFYELGTGKEDPARNSGSLHPMPWTIMVEGEIKRPKATFDVESIIRMHPSLEERVYRMRCVEAWSMVIPWIGIPLATVIKKLEPTSKARYVVFETLYDPRQMPGQRLSTLPWPYVEALRIDEALHPLTILAVGLYGETLPVQDGAPIRLVVPWKYGFKSIKSIVKLKFVASRPATTWNEAAPQEYGFYANVNPDVDHPRWSQANERRIGESGARKTLLFNGYADQVAPLYSGMDLRKDF